MPTRYSRRSFLTGVLACGTFSAAAAYLLPGGQGPVLVTPDVTLKLMSGEDLTGVRDALIKEWNDTHPHIQVDTVAAIATGTTDERAAMLGSAESGTADIINLDVIHVPEFAAKGLIAPIRLDASRFVDATLRTSRVFGERDRFWAAPFNTDVGMLFVRNRNSGPAANSLAAVFDALTPDSHQFVGQLVPGSGTQAREPFVVNVLEHALAHDVAILDANGQPSLDLARWQAALLPLRAAVAAGKVTATATEDESRDVFLQSKYRYMRNWPVKYQELRARQDSDAVAGELLVTKLPRGILGGASLAVVATSRYQREAAQLTEFLTGPDAQRRIAQAGFAPTRTDAFAASSLQVDIPGLRDAVDISLPRPIHRNYLQFSSVVYDRVGDMIANDTPLTKDFIDDMRAALA